MRLCILFSFLIVIFSATVCVGNDGLPVHLHNHTAITLLIDPLDGRIVDANSAAVEFYGYTIQQMKNMKIQQINVLPPEDVEKEYKSAEKQNRNYFIFPHKLASGEIRTVEVYSSPYRTDTNSSLLLSIIHDVEDKTVVEKELLEYKGRLEELVGKQVESIVDASIRERWLVFIGGGVLFVLSVIAIRKHLQSKLFRQKYEVEQRCRELLARFETLVQNAHDAILLADESGKIVEANREAMNAYGYSRDEFLGLNMRDIRDGAAGEYDQIQRTAQEKNGHTYEARHLRKDGSFFPVESSISSLEIGNRTYYQHIIRNISQRKRTEEERSAIIDLLHKSNADKDLLFSIIAHDLRSPMASILGLTDVLKERADIFTPEELHEVCFEVNRSTQNVMLLLDDLLQWARMNQGGLDFSPSEYNLRRVAREAIQPLEGAAASKEIRMSEEIADNISVFIDRPMVNTVIRNIVSNAIKFTGKGGHIRVGSEIQDGFVRIGISDSGIGIDGSVLDRIFEHDNSKRRPGTNGEKGSGLGLMLCREFIERHGGRIWVTSREAEGTQVSFTLPRRELVAT